MVERIEVLNAMPFSTNIFTDFGDALICGFHGFLKQSSLILCLLTRKQALLSSWRPTPKEARIGLLSKRSPMCQCLDLSRDTCMNIRLHLGGNPMNLPLRISLIEFFRRYA